MKNAAFCAALALSMTHAPYASSADGAPTPAHQQPPTQHAFDPSTIGKHAIVFFKGGIPDEIEPRGHIVYALYERMKCTLPLAAAPSMQQAEVSFGKGLAPACWAKLASPAGDQVVIVNAWGYSESLSLINLFRATVQRDGSMKVGARATTPEQIKENLERFQHSIR